MKINTINCMFLILRQFDGGLQGTIRLWLRVSEAGQCG